jgi:hypothetical protein
MKSSRKPLSKGTLRVLRKSGITAFVVSLSGFLVVFLVLVMPFDVSYQFELAYAGIGLIALGFASLAGLMAILRSSVPVDQATRRKIRAYCWSAGPVGYLLSILMLTKESEIPPDDQAGAGGSPKE